MNDLLEIFTRKNIAILLALDESEESLRDLAEKAGCSPAKAHQALKLFRRLGLVDVKKEKNRLIYRPHRESELFRHVKMLWNVYRLQTAPAFRRLRKAGVVGVYGSFAKGRDTPQSDIDLVIRTEKKGLELRPHVRELERVLGKPVRPLLLTKKRAEEIRSKDREFYNRLRFSSVSFGGDLFEGD